MKKLNENLSEIFDVDPIELPEVSDSFNVEKSNELVVSDTKDESDIEVDYSIARNNIKNLIRKGDGAIDELMKVATESEHPRAYEVAANFIKTLADLNKDLLELQKKRKDLNIEQQNSSQTTNIDKAVFVGSTAELIKMIKNS